MAQLPARGAVGGCWLGARPGGASVGARAAPPPGRRAVLRPDARAAQAGAAQAHRLHGEVLPHAPLRLELGAAQVHPQDQDPRLQR